MKNIRDRCFHKYNTRREDLTDYNINRDELIEKNIAKFLLGKYLKIRRDFYFRLKQLPFPEISRQRAGRALSKLADKDIVIKYNDKHSMLWRTKFSLSLIMDQ